MILGKLVKSKEDFEEQFGSGTQKRNRVFLAVYLHLEKTGCLGYFPGIDDPTQSKIDFIDKLVESTEARINRHFPRNIEYTRSLLGKNYITSAQVTPYNMGMSENAAHVCYIENSRPKTADGQPLIVKQRAGKFMRRLLKEHRVDEMYGNEFVNHYLELFTQRWKSEGDLNRFTLKLDRDFRYIYNSDNHVSDLGSCMTDEGFESFYNDHLDAYAASLLNEDGQIVSRCVVYNEVYMTADNGETEDKVLRLAERQYSSRGSNVFSQMLVDKLVHGGHIDGWKRIGADASSSDAFILTNLGSISDRELYVILTNYDVNTDTTPYMDSFKYYSDIDDKAYNCSGMGRCFNLTYTNGRGNGAEYDEYNDEYVDDDLTSVRTYDSEGRYHEETVSVGYAENNLEYSSYFDSYLADSLYSDIMNDSVPRCMKDSLEKEYKQENWNYDEVEDEYVDEDLVMVHILHGDVYKLMDTAESNLNSYIELEDGNFYDELTEELQKLEQCA